MFETQAVSVDDFHKQTNKQTKKIKSASVLSENIQISFLQHKQRVWRFDIDFQISPLPEFQKETKSWIVLLSKWIYISVELLTTVVWTIYKQPQHFYLRCFIGFLHCSQRGMMKLLLIAWIPNCIRTLCSQIYTAGGLHQRSVWTKPRVIFPVQHSQVIWYRYEINKYFDV